MCVAPPRRNEDGLICFESKPQPNPRAANRARKFDFCVLPKLPSRCHICDESLDYPQRRMVYYHALRFSTPFAALSVAKLYRDGTLFQVNRELADVTRNLGSLTPQWEKAAAKLETIE